MLTRYSQWAIVSNKYAMLVKIFQYIWLLFIWKTYLYQPSGLPTVDLLISFTVDKMKVNDFRRTVAPRETPSSGTTASQSRALKWDKSPKASLRPWDQGKLLTFAMELFRYIRVTGLPFNNKLGCLFKKLKILLYKNNLSSCWSYLASQWLPFINLKSSMVLLSTSRKCCWIVGGVIAWVVNSQAEWPDG